MAYIHLLVQLWNCFKCPLFIFSIVRLEPTNLWENTHITVLVKLQNTLIIVLRNRILLNRWERGLGLQVYHYEVYHFKIIISVIKTKHMRKQFCLLLITGHTYVPLILPPTPWCGKAVVCHTIMAMDLFKRNGADFELLPHIKWA